MNQDRLKKIAPVCRRCGYVYDPAKPKHPIVIMQGPDGYAYAACDQCMADLHTAADDYEKVRILESLKVLHEFYVMRRQKIH